MKFLAQLDQKFPDVAEGVDHFHFVFNRLRIVPQHLLGALKCKSLFFYQVIDCADVVDVFLCELTVALPVFFGLDNIKL